MGREVVTVRSAEPADLPALAVLLTEVGAEHPLGAPLGVPEPGVMLERLRAFVAHPTSRLSLAVAEDDEIVGAAISQVEEPGLFSEHPWLHLEVLFVQPQARRRGVGRALMADQAEHADRAELPSIVTHPTTGARSEQRFLSRLGFAAVGSRRTADTAALRRRLDAEQQRGGLGTLIARRRAIHDRLTTPPEGLPLLEAQEVSSRRQVRRAELMRRSSSSTTSTR